MDCYRLLNCWCDSKIQANRVPPSVFFKLVTNKNILFILSLLSKSMHCNSLNKSNISYEGKWQNIMIYILPMWLHYDQLSANVIGWLWPTDCLHANYLLLGQSQHIHIVEPCSISLWFLNWNIKNQKDIYEVSICELFTSDFCKWTSALYWNGHPGGSSRKKYYFQGI